MKSIYNPTADKVSIIIEGIEYSVEAGKSTDVKDEIAEKWQHTHEFLQTKDSKEVKVEAKKEVKEEIKKVTNKVATKK